MLSVIMLSVITLSVIILSVVTLIVLAPFFAFACVRIIYQFFCCSLFQFFSTQKKVLQLKEILTQFLYQSSKVTVVLLFKPQTDKETLAVFIFCNLQICPNKLACLPLGSYSSLV